ncbi:BlaI/MecI/CopY family transcriptional regulator [Paenibacillus puerhi]|nr:BlaI/MecI/CopY family transcriptional regulator [Paenibacillus puerhi]
MYGGSPAAMLMHFIQEESLTKEEIQELKKMLDEKG